MPDLSNRGVGRWGAVTGLLIAYLLLDRLEVALGPARGLLVPLDPSLGLGFAALLLGGVRLLPVVVLGELGSAMMPGAGLSALPAALAWAVLVSVIWWGGAWVMRRAADPRLGAQHDLVWLVLIAGGGALLSAVVRLALESGFERLSVDLGPALVRGWIGDMIGVMVVAPLILANRHWPARPGRSVLIEAAAQGLVATTMLWSLFWLPSAAQLQLYDLLVLPAIWVAARFGVRGATIINVVVQIGILAAVVTREIDADEVTLYQFRMLVLTLSTLVLGVAVVERRRAEDGLHQRQDELARCSRLTLAGEMAAALAHELNQPLAAALTYARAAQRLLDQPGVDPARLRAALDGTAGQAERAGRIIATLREFIGRGTLDCRPQSLPAVIRDCVALVAPDCQRAGIRIETALDRGLPSLSIDAVQIQLVLVNLLRNAIEALTSRTGARRVVSVAASADPEGGVVVEVADSGPGIDEAAATRLFQPFSTTKAAGMGLGLAIGRTIIEAHGGRLWLAGTGPSGCSFRFTLPAEGPKGRAGGSR